jgi:Protein of unknown function (DUF3887)
MRVVWSLVPDDTAAIMALRGGKSIVTAGDHQAVLVGDPGAASAIQTIAPCRSSDPDMRTFTHVLFALTFSLATPVHAQLTRDAAIAKAEAILKNLQDGKTGDIVKEFDTKMKEGLPEAKLQGAWSAVVGQFGAFKNIEGRREGQVRGRQAVELILAFEKQTIVQRTVFDGEGKVAGLVFQPLSNALLPGK